MMEQILQRCTQQQVEPVMLLAKIVDQIRPDKPDQANQAALAIQALCHILDHHAEYAALLRDSVLRLLAERKPTSLYADAGIQATTGFFTEMRRRVGHKLLPEVLDANYLKDIFSLIFTHQSDEIWVHDVPDYVWIALLHALRFDNAQPDLVKQSQQGLIDAAQVLSYRLSASGLEPELLRNHPELENHASPFLIQNVECNEFLQSVESDHTYLENSALSNASQTNANHVLVMLEQCRTVIVKIKRNSAQTGTSISLTFLLQGISQQLVRLEMLLNLMLCLRKKSGVEPIAVSLFKTLVSAECHKNDLAQHWQQNMEILALRVTENASRTGEHYITETHSEYYALMRSAMGAGIIVGFMAMFKIFIAKAHMPLLTEAILFSLNYGLGFVVIHLLHFTIATKQPAMTAAAIAASIDTVDGKNVELDRLVTIIAQTMRSQTIAIFGNVALAVPMSMLIAWVFMLSTGEHFVSVDKAHRLLADIDPIHSGALFYAAIAGVCLFLSGLIAGYHDNIAIYNKIPQRLKALKWLQKALGILRLNRVADYVENNLGAIAGNFYFGCLLGGMATLGVLLGLPIDIRHITFSSAFVGFSLVGLDFQVTGETALMAFFGVLLIGTVNLLVSFSLALYVAMKSRKVSFAQWRVLIKAILKRLWQNPREFLFAPRESPQ